MKRKCILIILSTLALFSCSSSDSSKQNTSESLYLKIAVFIDKTASISETGISEIITSDFNELINLFEQNEGELLITMIKPNSKLKPQKYRFYQTKLPSKKFGQSLEEYAKDVYENIGDPKKNLENNKITKKELQENLISVCDYSNLYKATDVNGAIEYGLKYLNEPLYLRNKRVVKAAFFVTDAQDTMQKQTGSLTDLKKDNLIFLIRKSSLDCVFSSLDPIEYTDFTNAISRLKQIIYGN